MTTPEPAAWIEIERLLDDALDLPLAEREAFVRAHAGSQQIASRVLDLLARETRLGGFLEPSPARDDEIRNAMNFAHETPDALDAGAMSARGASSASSDRAGWRPYGSPNAPTALTRRRSR